MMTNRWLNWVLSAVVAIGLVLVSIHERPRLAQQRAEFLGQEVVLLEEQDLVVADRGEIELAPTLVPQRNSPTVAPTQASSAPIPSATASPTPTPTPTPTQPSYPLDDWGIVAGHPLGVEVGMEVLDAGGNAVDAAIAVSYALGVVEPFGSGLGGGGSMVVYEIGQPPVAYDYREIAPLSGEIPASEIGVPGFVAGMEYIHARHSTIPLANLIEPAARYAEDGITVGDYLNERLVRAAHRMPIHMAPRFYPNGVAVAEGTLLRQPEYAAALRLIQEQGSDAFYNGPIGQSIVDVVPGLEMADFAAYEVLELQPPVGSYAGFEVVGAAMPVSGATVIQTLQLAEALGINEMELGSAEFYHAFNQAWRAAQSQRIAFVGDPSFEQVDQEWLLSPEHTQELVAQIPPDGFIDVGEWEDPLSTESDTTHVTIVDRNGTMVVFTNTLSNFFGSGLMASGFFLNDQLKNYSHDPESINSAKPGKRPRSFTAPMILARDGRPVLGLGSPGGRRIPTQIAEVIVRWAGFDIPIVEAIAAPRWHLESHEMQVEQTPPDSVVAQLSEWGYEITTEIPTTEFYGAVEALAVNWETGVVHGASDKRREGAWDAHSRPRDEAQADRIG